MSEIETLLTALLNGETVDFEPKTRIERYLKNCCDMCGCDGLPTPITNVDALLYALSEKLAGGGGSGGGGNSGGSGIIDVTELPTENIDENAVYKMSVEADESVEVWVVDSTKNRVAPFEDIFASMLQTAVYSPKQVVDELPSAPSPMVFDGANGTVTIPLYILRESGEPYLSQDGTTCTSLSFMGMTYRRKITNLDDATADGVYTILGESHTAYSIPNSESEVYLYDQDAGWQNNTLKYKMLEQTLRQANAVINGVRHLTLQTGADSYYDEVKEQFPTKIFVKKIQFAFHDNHIVTIPNFVAGLSNSSLGQNVDGLYVEVLNLPETIVCFEPEAFKYCDTVSVINFGGEKDKWRAIVKCNGWRGSSHPISNFTVYCTDGEIVYVDGTET